MSQNGTPRARRRKMQKPSKTNYAQIGFVFAALCLAAVGLREPFMVSRIVLFVLAAIVAAAPFVFLALDRKRTVREAEINADNAAKRQEQTRRELRRMMRSQVEAMRMRIPANDNAETRRAAIVAFATEELLPNVSHGIIASERPLWLQEIYAYSETLLGKPAAQPQLELTLVAPLAPAQVLADACAAQIATAGWEASGEGDDLTVRSGTARALLRRLHSDAAIDAAAVASFVDALKAAGFARGAIVANQAFAPEALQDARAHGVGLIRPAHIPAFLDWVARAQSPEKKSA